MTLQITLLGEQALTDTDGNVRARSSRSIELLAFLVAHGGAPQTRQRIAATLWPDSTDEQALTNLRRELHHLREHWPRLDALILAGSRTLEWREIGRAHV